jgi:hypothetical protein
MGLRKHGIPSNSGAVQGYRYNARVLARHLAAKHLGIELPRPRLEATEIVPLLLSEASRGPELWHQRSYLARVVSLDPAVGISDEGITPLADFTDAAGPDSIAVALESNGRDDPYPAIYVRRGGMVKEHLLPPHPLLDFEGAAYQDQLASAMGGLISPSLSKAAP